MIANAPSNIKTLLTYMNLSLLEKAQILYFLNEQLSSVYAPMKMTRSSPDNTYMLFSNEKNLHVEICQQNEKFPTDLFEEIIYGEYVPETRASIVEQKEHHQAYIAITVGSGSNPTPDSPELNDLLGKYGADQSNQEFETKLALCHALAGYIINKRRPDAIYWYQSKQFIYPDHYDFFKNDAFPLSLFVKPIYITQENSDQAARINGVRTYGAAHLVGREIIFYPAAVPRDWISQRIHTLIQNIRKYGRFYAHTDSFGLNSAESIRILHGKPDIEGHEEVIELAVDYCEEYRIGEFQQANHLIEAVTSAFSYRNTELNSDEMSATSDRKSDDTFAQLDPLNPIDSEILRRLKQKRQMDSATDFQQDSTRVLTDQLEHASRSMINRKVSNTISSPKLNVFGKRN